MRKAAACSRPATHRPFSPPPTTRHHDHRGKTRRPRLGPSPPPVTISPPATSPRITSPPTTSPPTTSPPATSCPSGTTSCPSGTTSRPHRTTSRRRRSTSRRRRSTSGRRGSTSGRRGSTSRCRGSTSRRRSTTCRRRRRRRDNRSPSHGSRRGGRIRPPRRSRHVEQRRVAEIQNVDVIARPLPRHEVGGLPEQRSGGNRASIPPGNRSGSLVQRAGTKLCLVGQLLVLLVVGERVEGGHVVEK